MYGALALSDVSMRKFRKRSKRTPGSTYSRTCCLAGHNSRHLVKKGWLPISGGLPVLSETRGEIFLLFIGLHPGVLVFVDVAVWLCNSIYVCEVRRYLRRGFNLFWRAHGLFLTVRLSMFATGCFSPVVVVDSVCCPGFSLCGFVVPPGHILVNPPFFPRPVARSTLGVASAGVVRLDKTSQQSTMWLFYIAAWICKFTLIQRGYRQFRFCLIIHNCFLLLLLLVLIF